MAFRLDRSTWQSDFSSANQRFLFVEDNNGRPFIVDTQSQVRFAVGGPGSGSYEAANTLFGPPTRNVFLTGYQERSAVNDLFGGPNQMERVISGRIDVPNVLQGSVPVDESGRYANPQRVRTGHGQLFTPPGGGGPGSPDAPSSGPGPEGTTRSFKQITREMFPWLDESLVDIYADAWADPGIPDPWMEVRQSKQYREAFPGNLRDDGSVRYSEIKYMQNIDSYREVFAEYGIPPDSFNQKFADLIENRVERGELEQRLGRTYEMVVSQGDDIRRFYADNFVDGGELSDTALLMSAIDDSGQSPVAFEHQLRAGQVGGAAAQFGFDIAVSDAMRMSGFGLNAQAARQFFGRAKDLLPKIGSLIERHNDSNDPFDLRDLEEALILQDPEEMSQIERLFAAESSSFSPTSGTFARTQSGGTPGLRPR